MRFRPFELAGLTLHFEVLMAFATAEAEGFGVVTDECYAFGGIDGAGAEMAVFDSIIEIVSIFCKLRDCRWTVG